MSTVHADRNHPSSQDGFFSGLSTIDTVEHDPLSGSTAVCVAQKEALVSLEKNITD